MNEKELLEELDKTENKKTVGDSYILGAVLGIVIPFIALIFFNSTVTNNDSFISFFNNLVGKKILSAVLSVLSLSNLVIFFLFLKLNKMKTVKGIVAATLILGILVYISKLFIQTSS
jgi:hypothetical protein